MFKTWRGYRIFTFIVTPTKYLLITRKKRITRQCRNLGDTVLIKGSKWISSVIGQIKDGCEKGQHCFCDAPAKGAQPDWPWRNSFQPNPNWEMGYKTTSLQSPRVWASWKAGRTRNCFRLKETKETWRLNALRDKGLDFCCCCCKGHYWNHRKFE